MSNYGSNFSKIFIFAFPVSLLHTCSPISFFLSVYLFLHKWTDINIDRYHSLSCTNAIKQILLKLLYQSCKVKEQCRKNCNFTQTHLSTYAAMRASVPSSTVHRSETPGISWPSMVDFWPRSLCCVRSCLQLHWKMGCLVSSASSSGFYIRCLCPLKGSRS